MTQPFPLVSKLTLSLGAFVAAAMSFAPAAQAQTAQMCTSASQQFCYRYLCNGMDANGTFSQDGCGFGCNDATAPRWYAPTVPVRVDLSTVPSELSTTQWNNIVNTSFSRWEGVSGSNLVFQNIGSTQTRSFGGNENAHEIFWINSASEFQQKVGNGVNGALGVTITPRVCFNPVQIVDADLVMNGAGNFNWVDFADNCGGGWCSSATSTLLHELGHFVGLGHPCQACGWTVMSAQSAVEIESPTNIDRSAVSALYPGQPGGLGYGCDGPQDCSSAPVCATVGDLSYCTQTCGTCPEGFECDSVDGQDLCVFAGGALATPAGLGEDCLQRQCESDLICVGGGQDFQCLQGCSNAANCPGNTYECLPLQNGGGVCVETSGEAQVGELCSETSLCAANLFCILETETSGICRTECNPANGSGCAANESCFELQNGAGACFPVGETGEGGVCESPLDCAPGRVCLTDSADGTAHCYQRCDQGFECTDDRQTCQALNGSLSYCDPLITTLTQPEPEPGVNEPDPGPGNPNEPEGVPIGTCRLSRGNYDCPNGEGCVDDGDGDDIGVCEPGAEGSLATGQLCDSSSDCSGGICHNGVCTRPCDFDCPDGSICDDEAIPGGLCKAQSCNDDPSICADGWGCEYSSANRYVCTTDAEPSLFCECTGTGGDADAGGPQAALALLAGLGLLVARRRRR